MADTGLSEYAGYLVYLILSSTKLHIGLGMFKTYDQAVGVAYSDATCRHIPECMDENDNDISITPLYSLEGGEDFAFDIKKNNEVDVTYYIVSVYNEYPWHRLWEATPAKNREKVLKELLADDKDAYKYCKGE